MGRGRRRRNDVSRSSVSRTTSHDIAERDKQLHTAAAINEILNKDWVDVTQLRKIAAVRGLVNNQIRARVWPYLLGVDPASSDTAELKARCEEEHRDSNVVHLDVIRSLFRLTPHWTEEARVAKQAELQRLINGVVASNPDVYYYQGLHDIASVLLLVLGEEAAYVHLRRLVQHHLRDFTRLTMDPVVQIVELLPALLTKLDPELGNFIKRSTCPAFFAVPWLVTWHSHDESSDLETSARLFDLFLASQPLMPLYVAAVGMVEARDRILRAECGLAEVHHAVQNVKLLHQIPLAQMASKALHAARQHPPSTLTRSSMQRLPVYSPTRNYPFEYMKTQMTEGRLMQGGCGCRLCHPRPEDSKPPESRLTRGGRGDKRGVMFARLAQLAKLTGTAAVIAVGMMAASVSVRGNPEDSSFLVEGVSDAISDLFMAS